MWICDHRSGYELNKSRNCLKQNNNNNNKHCNGELPIFFIFWEPFYVMFTWTGPIAGIFWYHWDYSFYRFQEGKRSFVMILTFDNQLWKGIQNILIWNLKILDINQYNLKSFLYYGQFGSLKFETYPNFRIMWKIKWKKKTNLKGKKNILEKSQLANANWPPIYGERYWQRKKSYP